jgi:hypothetical protein
MKQRDYKNLDWFLNRIGKTVFYVYPCFNKFDSLKPVTIMDKDTALDLYNLGINNKRMFFESHKDFFDFFYN